MKSGIHPKYVEAKVTCACGNSWTTMSTRANLHTDLCSKCHPFYTGEQRIVDTAGQVDRFMRRMGRRQAPQPKTDTSRAPVPVPAQERPTLAEVAASLPEQEPVAAADVAPIADSTTSSAPLSESVTSQLDPATVPTSETVAEGIEPATVGSDTGALPVSESLEAREAAQAAP